MGHQFWQLMERGGPVMWPLLAMSIISLTLIFDRMLFWWRHRRNAAQVLRLNDALRRGDRQQAARLSKGSGPFAEVARQMLEDGATDSVALEAVQNQRPRLERFMIILSTIITAAPLLGILGTVSGIIQSFRLLGEQSVLTDPRDVSAGIAEALLTTAAGLVIALVTLFPYMAFRTQVDRAITRLETVIAAAQQGLRGEHAGAKSGHEAAGFDGRATSTEPESERSSGRQPSRSSRA